MWHHYADSKTKKKERVRVSHPILQHWQFYQLVPSAI
jgi:hypothetical protein